MNKHCEACGTDLAAFATDGFCSACLLEQGISPPGNAASPLLSRFGDYELIDEIARGGMGMVYKARQRGLSRIVALKTILAGRLAKPDDIARFRVEAEAAANLKHPNIVAIHEVGECDGQHYFSMDYIEGQSLSALVRDGPLAAPLAARYVEKIARAVHYAHERGVLHRDLKSSNVLLDANDEPHVTDFGLAKRLDSDTDLTLSGQVLGTPSFMPPEQAGAQRDQMGPRSDVYSLGAILYHLLTGRPPFVGADVHAILAQVIRTEALTPRLLNPSAPRDLETIALKCLEKEPSRRYQSALALAEDIARHLAHEPIHAVPPSTIYRARKFVRRHRLGVAASACFVLVLTAATVVSAVFGIRATREKTRAVKAEATATVAAGVAQRNAELAKARAAEALTVLDFFTHNVLSTARPEGRAGGLGREVTVRRAIEAAEPQVSLLFTNKPRFEARVRHSIGMTYDFLGEYSNAIPQLKRALALMEGEYGPDDTNTLIVVNALGRAYQSANRLSDAVPLLEEAVRRSKAVSGPEHPVTIDSMSHLALAYYNTAHPDQALPLYEKVLEVDRATGGKDQPRILATMNNLASAYRKTGQWPKAVALYEELVPLCRTNPAVDLNQKMEAMAGLSEMYSERGHWTPALELREEVLQLTQRKYGPDDRVTLNMMNNLGMAYSKAGRLPEALPIYKAVLQLRTTKDGPDNASTLATLNALARGYLATNQFADAEKLLREWLPILEKKQPGLSPTLTLQGLLGWALLGQKKYTEAELLLVQSYEGLKKRQDERPDERPSASRTQRLKEIAEHLGKLYEALEKPDQAAHWRELAR